MKHALMPFRKRSMRSAREWGYRPFARLSRELDDLMGTCYGDVLDPESFMDRDFSIELSGTNGDILVRAKLPGMDREDIQVSLDEDVLSIRALRNERRETRRRNFHVSEMNYGGVSRSIRLPSRVDYEHASATFKHGVLELRLPKLDASKREKKRIPVLMD